MKKISKKIKILVVILLAVLVAAGVALGAYLYFHALQQNELRESLITNCEKNGNPLREVLQKRIEKEIDQAKHPELYEKILPYLSPEELKELVDKQIEEREEEKEEVAPIDCKEQYK
jgi:hypothetical protein